RIAPGCSRHVDKMQQYLGAFNVSEETIAETVSFVSALDQPWNVGNDEAAVVAQADHTQVRRERGEWVVGNLRTCRRDARDECGLSRIGKSDEPDVGEQSQFEAEELLFPSLARLRASRCTIGGAYEARVSRAAPASAGDEHSLPLFRQISEQTKVALR